MLKDMTRAGLIQIWFAAVVVVILSGIVVGAGVTASNAAVLLALALVPPAIVLMLWPAVQPSSIAEVLHDVDRQV